MKIKRINDMENYIMSQGTVSLEELASFFGISINTVRRDLKEILENPLIIKCYGGVSTVNASPSIIPYSERIEKYKNEKERIGCKAAELVKDGMCIFLDSGTTTINILPYLKDKRNVTIVSHNFSILGNAINYPNLSVISLGGQYSKDTNSFYAFSSLSAFDHVYLDICFLASVGVTPHTGLTNSNFLETEFKRIAAQHSNCRVLLADNSKFGKDASFTFCKFGDLSYVVTDKTLKEEYEYEAIKNNVKIIYAT